MPDSESADSSTTGRSTRARNEPVSGVPFTRTVPTGSVVATRARSLGRPTTWLAASVTVELWRPGWGIGPTTRPPLPTAKPGGPAGRAASTAAVAPGARAGTSVVAFPDPVTSWT